MRRCVADLFCLLTRRARLGFAGNAHAPATDLKWEPSAQVRAVREAIGTGCTLRVVCKTVAAPLN